MAHVSVPSVPYTPQFYYVFQEPPSLDTARRTHEMTSAVHSWFDAGIPFFTMQAIRDVCQQLDRFNKNGRKILVKGLDGTMVEYKIMTGRKIRCFEPNREWIVGKPLLYYVPIQTLTSVELDNKPGVACCNLVVRYEIEVRDKYTKEIINDCQHLSFEEVQRFFVTMREIWEASQPCKQLRSMLASKRTQLKVTKIVSFACASVSHDHRSREARRAAFQHALILTLRDIFDKGRGKYNKIRCYAQDPIYTSVDKLVLQHFGIDVLDNPRGLLEVDDFSVVISCAADFCVKQIVSDLAKPAMMIWDRVHEDAEADETICGLPW
ncbi:hypothetical protein EV356DRAFT_166983 [Viridothelium virens]|uniref:SRR1-like domain-containing protein n=1 Tax=Viridothelium virens TaxID=1048519 RepID=A0A6A6HMK6_VIRVR|nr:hypothetical protein EV356DRAFT_166983 [Viridothelium virens]